MHRGLSVIPRRARASLRWTSRESHPNHLLARQTSPLGDKPVMSCVSRHVPAARCFFEIDGLSPIGTARRDRTCLLLLVMQAQSLDCQRRSFGEDDALAVDHLRIERSAGSLSESPG